MEFSNLFTAAMGALLSVSCIIPYCFFGTVLTEQLCAVGYTVYQSQWYLLHAKHQKYCQMMIIYSQIKRKIHGFGIVSCDLNIFLSVRLLKI